MSFAASGTPYRLTTFGISINFIFAKESQIAILMKVLIIKRERNDYV